MYPVTPSVPGPQPPLLGLFPVTIYSEDNSSIHITHGVWLNSYDTSSVIEHKRQLQ